MMSLNYIGVLAKFLYCWLHWLFLLLHQLYILFKKVADSHIKSLINFIFIQLTIVNKLEVPIKSKISDYNLSKLTGWNQKCNVTRPLNKRFAMNLLTAVTIPSKPQKDYKSSESKFLFTC